MPLTLVSRRTAFFICLAVSAAAASKPVLPARVDHLIDVLFRAPEFEQAKLSPGGAYLAYLHEQRGHTVLSSFEFKTGKTYVLSQIPEEANQLDPGDEQMIGNFEWLGPGQLIFDDTVNNNTMTGYWLATAQLRRCRKLESGNPLHLLDSLPWNADTAYFIDDSRGSYGAPWRLNKKSLSLYELPGNPGHVLEWLADLGGKLRLAIVAEPDSRTATLYRPIDREDWTPILLPESSGPITFNPDGSTVLLAFPDAEGRYVLQNFSLEGIRLVGPRLGHPVYDIIPTAVLSDTKTGAPVGVRYDTDGPAVQWFDSRFGKIQSDVQRLQPAGFSIPIGVVETGEYLIETTSDTRPPALSLYNATSGTLRPLLRQLPAADEMPWAAKQPIAFPARDGHTLHGYLTMPLHPPADRKVPLVALAHGGPQTRDTPGFDPQVQFLAALGYGVLQVDYRGSSGYGTEHELHDLLEVNEYSVNDVLDAIDWTISHFPVDSRRIIACGASYGAYISLALATRYPERIAAAVGFSGVYDWESQFRFSRRTNSDLLKWKSSYYVDPAANRDQYRRYSPLNAVNQVRCPVLLLHGGSDTVVDIAQTTKMANALRKAGKSVEVVKDADVVHDLPRTSQRRTFYTNLAAFLLKNVPPDPSP
jgi:dipeptidyl aminopeptidase/acylaminoacyl peptidase